MILVFALLSSSELHSPAWLQHPCFFSPPTHTCLGPDTASRPLPSLSATALHFLFRPPGSAARPHNPSRHTARPSRSPWVTHPAAIACFRAIPGQPYGLFASLFFLSSPYTPARPHTHTHRHAWRARFLSLRACCVFVGFGFALFSLLAWFLCSVHGCRRSLARSLARSSSTHLYFYTLFFLRIEAVLFGPS